ncbi:MAG: SAM-dependent methyltransferase [Opitutaceae bacterium]|nr:SAM-dependent methyltransferase [Opitutaceae bacterium]
MRICPVAVAAVAGVAGICALASAPSAGRNGGMLATSQAGYAKPLAGELAGAGLVPREQGPGWVLCDGGSGRELPEPAFAWLRLPAPREFRGARINALGRQIADYLADSLRDERLETVWPCVWGGAGEIAGLTRRVTAVQKTFQDLLRRKLSRVARLARTGMPSGLGPVRGFFVCFTDFDRAFAAREAVLGGQRRMADDAAAPSRSYLKVEEAYGVLGAEPRPGETVADLGAAPGGWSYSAARRGARVVAVDNGPLKGGALGHPGIEHRREDAFRFRPAPGETFDWLFCDLVAEPHQVLRHLVAPWLERRWCRRFIINLKFGRVDPLGLLRELRMPASPFALNAADFRIRHLYHDREEFTVVGGLRP